MWWEQWSWIGGDERGLVERGKGIDSMKKTAQMLWQNQAKEENLILSLIYALLLHSTIPNSCNPFLSRKMSVKEHWSTTLAFFFFSACVITTQLLCHCPIFQKCHRGHFCLVDSWCFPLKPVVDPVLLHGEPVYSQQLIKLFFLIYIPPHC